MNYRVRPSCWCVMFLAVLSGDSSHAFAADPKSPGAQATPVAAADERAVLPADLPDGPKDRMMLRYLQELSEQALVRREREYEKIKTAADAVAYQQRMKQFFVERLGGWPERTPLNAQVTGRQMRDGYQVDKILFESRPSHHVTALLFLPAGKGPFPGVLVPCGHSAIGKAEEKYQRASILLAKNGIAALCYDPPGQGERHQLLRADDKTKGPSHNDLGVGCIPLGTCLAQYFIWDGMRALDYLASRPEIDPARLGCTGNSGGGTQTSYLMALDDRIACAAPSCYITSMRKLLEKNGPQDAEQNIFGQVAFGMTHAEYVMMRAPKPTLLCTATRDSFNIVGAWDTYREAKRFYARFGNPERIDLVETDEPHGFHLQLREGSARWMLRWLSQVDKPITEPDFPVLTGVEAQVTASGQVLRLPGERTIYDLNAEAELRLARERKGLWTAEPREKLLERVRHLAGIRPLNEIPKYKAQVVGTVERDGYQLRKLVFAVERNLALPAYALVPRQRSGDTVLFVGGRDGKADAFSDRGEWAKAAQAGHLVVAVDVRGLGELRAPSLTPSDWYRAYILEKSYVGMWAEDILAVARWAINYESADKAQPIRVVGVGLVGPSVLHAAVLEPKLFSKAEVRGSLNSWADVIHGRATTSQLYTIVHGALTAYDLPDLVHALPPEKIAIIDARDSDNRPVASPAR